MKKVELVDNGYLLFANIKQIRRKSESGKNKNWEGEK